MNWSPFLLFYFSFCTLVILVSDVALRYGVEVVAKETNVSSRGGACIDNAHVTSGVDDANDATYWSSEVLLKIFRIQSDAWGIFKGKESAAR